MTLMNPLATVVFDVVGTIGPAAARPGPSSPSETSPAADGRDGMPLMFERGPLVPMDFNCDPPCFGMAWELPSYPPAHFEWWPIRADGRKRAPKGRGLGVAASIEAAGFAAGKLTVVGLGIRAPGQITPESRDAIASADVVYYSTDSSSAVPLPDFLAAISEIKPGCTSIDDEAGGTYAEQVERRVARVFESVASGEDVCFVTYGHPGICFDLGHELVRKAHDFGWKAVMLPAVSSLDCLFADLLLDLAVNGVQVFDAAAFVARNRNVDKSVPIVLLQSWRLNRDGRSSLIAKLKTFAGSHQCYSYRAATSAEGRPIVDPCTVADLAGRKIEEGRILFIPAEKPARFNRTLLEKLVGR